MWRRRLLSKAAIADIPALKHVRGAVSENILRDPSKVTDAHYEWFISNPGLHKWEDRGRIVGFSAADPRDGSIWALFVLPEYEGRGIGKALLAEACETLRVGGHAQARLSTGASTRAEAFYRRAGWSVTDANSREILFERPL